MGIPVRGPKDLPMRGTGVAARAKSRICRAKMALRLMAETAMPREAAFFNGLLVGSFRFMVWSFVWRSVRLSMVEPAGPRRGHLLGRSPRVPRAGMGPERVPVAIC